MIFSWKTGTYQLESQPEISNILSFKLTTWIPHWIWSYTGCEWNPKLHKASGNTLGPEFHLVTYASHKWRLSGKALLKNKQHYWEVSKMCQKRYQQDILDSGTPLNITLKRRLYLSYYNRHNHCDQFRSKLPLLPFSQNSERTEVVTWRRLTRIWNAGVVCQSETPH